MRERGELIAIISERLHKKYPDAKYELKWTTAEQLLIATILAAQCTDERVNKVTQTLFIKYPDAAAFANASLEDLENDVRPTGFYRNKAKSIQAACRMLVERFDGTVPPSMEQMLELPAVARKTANVVLNNAFKIPSGVIVDSHVARVSQRMGLTDSDKPDKIEQDLMSSVPKDEWIQFGCALVLHGRYTCTATKPDCNSCLFTDVCPKVNVQQPEEQPAQQTNKRKKTKSAPARKATADAEQEISPSPGTEADKDQIRVEAVQINSSHVTTDSAERGSNSALDKVQANSYGVLPAAWQSLLQAELEKPYFKDLENFLEQERKSFTIYPPADEVFTAFHLTAPEEVKVLLLGQDPYPSPGHAHGLCFSVKPGVKQPASLRNMFIELREDLGCAIPNHGYLVDWAKQGMLMVNAVLTVREGEANSHAGKGWEQFTDAVIRALNAHSEPVVFVLWGNYAQKKSKLIDEAKHTIIRCAHPSPLSVKKFMGSKPYSLINQALEKHGKSPINWQIADA